LQETQGDLGLSSNLKQGIFFLMKEVVSGFAFWQLLRVQQLVFEDVFVREIELTVDIVAKALGKMAFLAFGKVYWHQE
jgi:hypothetical protein